MTDDGGLLQKVGRALDRECLTMLAEKRTKERQTIEFIYVKNKDKQILIFV